MANPILSSAAFATANMKPVPDEQIDALWGQNIADNTGFLRSAGIAHIVWKGDNTGTAQASSSADFYLDGSYVNMCFIPKTHNQLNGTFNFKGTFHEPGGSNPDVYGTWTFALKGDLGTYIASGGSTAANASDLWWATSAAISVDTTSYVSPNSWALISLSFSGTSADSASPSTTSRTITYSFEETPLFYTVWA